MRSTIKSTFLMAALSLLAIPALADNAPAQAQAPAQAPAQASSIVGDYSCQRVDASNASTTYPMSITKTNETYTFEWDDSTGNAVMYGTGIMHPAMTNVVSASFWNPANTDVSGVEIFEVKPDGSLQSNWLLQSGKSGGTEVCTKSK